MYIVVVGGGKVGFYLTRTLLEEGHEMLVIEQDAAKCDQIAEELGQVAMRGDGCEAATLAQAGTGRADMLIAVTGDDEDNLVACQVAKHKFDVRRTIARINNPKNEEIFRRLGIDVTVSSTKLILEHIEQEVPTHPLMHLHTLRASGLEIVDVRILDGSATAGRPLRQVVLPPDCVVALIVDREGQARIPSPDTVLVPGDEVVAVVRPQVEVALRAALTGI